MDTQQEQARRNTNTTKILSYLKAHGQATNVQLTHEGGYRFSARINELRKAGHKITTLRKAGGLFLYTYHGHKDDPPEYENASIFEGLECDSD